MPKACPYNSRSSVNLPTIMVFLWPAARALHYNVWRPEKLPGASVLAGVARTGSRALETDDVYVARELVFAPVGTFCGYDVIICARGHCLAVVFAVPSLRGGGKMGKLLAPAVEDVAVEVDDRLV